LQKDGSALKLPALSRTFNLLDQDFLSVIYLSNIYLHSANQLECLFASKYNSKAFTELVNHALVSYDSPTIILFKYRSTTSSGIIGAFNLSSWRNDGKYHGNSGCYLFSLTPKFNLYLPKSDQGAKNYIYMDNSKNERPGIGFGKTKDNNFRLWIDGVEPDWSYAETQDETFCPGSLIDNDDNDEKNHFINIEYVEVWGLSSILDNVETDDGMMSKKQWITFNQERLPKLSATAKDPKIAETLAGFNNKISSLAPKDEIPAWNYRYSGDEKDFPDNDYEEEKKKSFVPSERKTDSNYYEKDEGYYNPFKERTENIMRRVENPS